MGCRWQKTWVKLMGYNTNESERKAKVTCPYCGSTDTELFSLFGQQLLTVQYYCNSCHTPFERIKDDDVLTDFAARKEGQA
jgi:DNA-directed RNA polymerase subunit RPC12/RpoP